MHTLIAFDVSDDHRRRRLVKVLRAFAHRVQKSVFEAADLRPAVYLRMRSLLEREIAPETDRLRYVRLCAACAARAEHYGAGAPPEELIDEPDFIG